MFAICFNEFKRHDSFSPPGVSIKPFSLSLASKHKNTDRSDAEQNVYRKKLRDKNIKCVTLMVAKQLNFLNKLCPQNCCYKMSILYVGKFCSKFIS